MALLYPFSLFLESLNKLHLYDLIWIGKFFNIAMTPPRSPDSEIDYLRKREWSPSCKVKIDKFLAFRPNKSKFRKLFEHRCQMKNHLTDKQKMTRLRCPFAIWICNRLEIIIKWNSEKRTCNLPILPNIRIVVFMYVPSGNEGISYRVGIIYHD